VYTPTTRELTIVEDLRELGYTLSIASPDLDGASGVSQWILTDLWKRHPGRFLATIFLKEVVSGYGGTGLSCIAACSTSIHWAVRGRSYQVDPENRTHCRATAV
jgi:hypothetical protein